MYCEDSLQKGLKAQNQVIDNLNKLVERWKNRITLSNLRLIDRFLNFELQILLHVRLKSGEIRVACLEMVDPAVKPIRGQQEIVSESKESTVFVDNVKLMQPPEHGGELSVPVSVRLQQIDSFYRLRMNSLYFSSVFGFVFGESFLDGKLNPFEIFRRKCGGVNDSQMLCEVVKSSPEVVNDVPSRTDGIEGEHWHQRNCAAQDSDWMLGNTILIYPENVYVIQGDSFGGEITQALFGPFDLYPEKNKAINRS